MYVYFSGKEVISLHMHPHRLPAVLTAAAMSAVCLAPSGKQNSLHASAAVSLPGIDVSKYQEEINWEEVARSDVKFAILRCCKVLHSIDDWEVDPTFEDNYREAKKAGIAVGCYLFTDAASQEEILADTEYMLEVLKDKSLELPVFYDLESATRQEHLPPEVFMPGLLAGLERIEDAGHTAGVYSSTAFFSECIDRQALIDAKYPIWEANYFNTTNGLSSPVGHDLSDEATIWQYSGCGRCPGVRTTVDRNICYTYQFFDRQAVITNSVLPGGTLKAGSNFTLAGTVSSDNVLRTITGTIHKKDHPNAVQSVTVYPMAKDYKLTGFFTKKLIFSTLTEGDYELCIRAVDSSGAEIEVVRSAFSVGPEEIPPETDVAAPIVTNPHSMPEFHFAGQGHRRETETVQKQPKAPFTVRMNAFFYEHWALRSVLKTANSIGIKCALERTPLYRIVSKGFCQLETGYLSLQIRKQLPSLQQPEQTAEV